MAGRGGVQAQLDAVMRLIHREHGGWSLLLLPLAHWIGPGAVRQPRPQPERGAQHTPAGQRRPSRPRCRQRPLFVWASTIPRHLMVL